MTARVRALIQEIGVLPVGVATVSDQADLYEMGMTSFGSVQLMMALEDAFGFEFPERMLTRRTFATISAISHAVHELAAETV